MIDMKRVLLTVCMFAFVAAGSAQSRSVKYKGEKGVSSVGGILGYAVDNKSVTAGVDYRYNIEDRIRLAPSVLYTLKNENISTLYANADVHYLARITEKITLYPIGGIGLSAWSLSYKGLTGLEELLSPEKDSETKIRLGLNLGFGGEIRVTRDVIAGAEFRYNLTNERIYDQAMILARAAYYF